MCLIFFAYKIHPDYPLIVAANRDEFYSRPTEPLHRWPDYPNILAGRDLQAGGTWMGMTDNGRFAAVTNYRSGKQGTAPKSRGYLITSFLNSDDSVDEFAKSLEVDRESYNGFNLIILAEGKVGYASNQADTFFQFVKPGVYGLSNSLLDSPWPKVENGKQQFQKAIEQEDPIDDLFNLLTDATQANTENLPQTGVEIEVEKLLSSTFIKSENYGTRSSSLIFWHKSGEVKFIEQQHDPDGEKKLTREVFQVKRKLSK